MAEGGTLVKNKISGVELRTYPMVWIDCEMTGLDVENDDILQVCCYVTDGNLNLLESDGFERVLSCSDEKLAAMDDWCQEFHGKTGLIDKVKASTATASEVEDELLQYITELVPAKKKAVLAGNSVHCDKEFLRKSMPRLIDYLHYRIIDVSTLSELSLRWATDIRDNRPAKKYTHNARDDILESIEELRYYKDHWLLR
ncbi:hypothetical protein CANCADRAFT_3548 [Tortispora caseinolytica NRRL Y-17796]|uniref:Exonuclease domain-containing protein n=1 Tax=Tortispora caseinolytica NRRL Y-17796 TaxID=767744 RepID=A0A1E4TAV1_9ASCO|nr:hypothetical protein CANCADRAFT_3548 [Tortispora caseinolytica NRRL Y-17796]